MLKKNILMIFSLLMISACGGSSDKDPNSSISFSLQTAQVHFAGEMNGNTPESKSVFGSVSGANSNIYIFAEINKTGVISHADISISGTVGELVLYPKDPSSLGEGTHRDTVKVKVCSDVSCNSQISGSPQIISVTYVVRIDPNTIDSDGDGISDVLDVFPQNPLEIRDNDYDGIGDNADNDDDNDGVNDSEDDFPLNSYVSSEYSQLTFNVSGVGNILVNDEVVECNHQCIFDIKNNRSAYNIVTISALSGENFTFSGSWGNSDYCLENGNSCSFNSSHISKTVFNLNFEENAYFSINAVVSSGGGFIERFGLVNCAQSCELKLYQKEFNTITLQPLSRPGYVFNGWSGDCTGMEDCIIEFVFDSSVNIEANFIRSNANINLCAGDQDTTFNGEGVVDLPKVGEFLPLCNGQVLVADQTNNRVDLLDVISQMTVKTIQLNAAPNYLALDEENKLLYVTHGKSSFISRINLATDEINQIYLKDGAQSLAVSPDGTLFVKQNDSILVHIYNSTTGIFDNTQEVIGNYLLFNDATQRLITSIYNYSYDINNLTLTKKGSSSGYGSGSGCDRVYISPDGEHTAKPCGAGNGPGYSVYDFYSHDPSIVLGVWETGAYPSGASFSPSSKYAFLTNRFKLQLFSTQTHQLVFEIGIASCTYHYTNKLAVSTDGKLLFAITDCGSNIESAKIKWIAYDTSE